MSLERAYTEAMLGAQRPDYAIVTLSQIRRFAQRTRPNGSILSFVAKSARLPQETQCYLTRTRIGILNPKSSVEKS